MRFWPLYAKFRLGYLGLLFSLLALNVSAWRGHLMASDWFCFGMDIGLWITFGSIGTRDRIIELQDRMMSQQSELLADYRERDKKNQAIAAKLFNAGHLMN